MERKDIPVNDKCALLASRIEQAMYDGTLGEMFKLGGVEYSRVRSCCDWLIDNKPERPLFIHHLISMLRIKNATQVSLDFATELHSMIVAREPVTDPKVLALIGE